MLLVGRNEASWPEREKGLMRNQAKPFPHQKRVRDVMYAFGTSNLIKVPIAVKYSVETPSGVRYTMCDHAGAFGACPVMAQYVKNG